MYLVVVVQIKQTPSQTWEHCRVLVVGCTLHSWPVEGACVLQLNVVAVEMIKLNLNVAMWFKCSTKI